MWNETDLNQILAGNPDLALVDGERSYQLDRGGSFNTKVASAPARPQPRLTPSGLTGPERRFALQILEPGLTTEFVFWLYEPEIRMKGQTYTPDFFALGVDGVTRLYEIKGAKKLGSQDRSSAKIRWATAVYGSDRIKFFWAKEKDDGGWLIREVKTSVAPARCLRDG